MSAATTATYLAAAALAVSAVGTVSSGISANNQAKTQAAIYGQQAERERQQAAADSQEFRDRQQRLEASRRAIMGATGVDATTGSPLLAAEDFAGETELQALKIRNGGDVRATRLEQSAVLARQKGRDEMNASFFRGGSLLLKAGQEFA